MGSWTEDPHLQVSPRTGSQSRPIPQHADIEGYRTKAAGNHADMTRNLCEDTAAELAWSYADSRITTVLEWHRICESIYQLSDLYTFVAVGNMEILILLM